MGTTVSLNLKISPTDKALFVSTAEALGLSPSAAMKIMIKRFNEEGGFPFPVERTHRINYNDSGLLRARVEGGKLIVPAAWRDDDDDEDEQ